MEPAVSRHFIALNRHKCPLSFGFVFLAADPSHYYYSHYLDHLHPYPSSVPAFDLLGHLLFIFHFLFSYLVLLFDRLGRRSLIQVDP